MGFLFRSVQAGACGRQKRKKENPQGPMPARMPVASRIPSRSLLKHHASSEGRNLGSQPRDVGQLGAEAHGVESRERDADRDDGDDLSAHAPSSRPRPTRRPWSRPTCETSEQKGKGHLGHRRDRLDQPPLVAPTAYQHQLDLLMTIPGIDRSSATHEASPWSNRNCPGTLGAVTLPPPLGHPSDPDQPGRPKAIERLDAKRYS